MSGLKKLRRKKVRFRIRKKISGSSERLRLSVFRSNAHIYAQLINDDNNHTLVSSSSKDKKLKGIKGTKSEQAKLVGEELAKKALQLGIKTCAFDRGGYLFHGRIKSLADGARQGGLEF